MSNTMTNTMQLAATENTSDLKSLFSLHEHSFHKYNAEISIVRIKTIKSSCKFLLSLLDKDVSTYKKDVKKIEDMEEALLINSIIHQKKEKKETHKQGSKKKPRKKSK